MGNTFHWHYPRGVFCEFWSGLTSPSLPALLGSLGITVSLFWACIVLLTPEFLGRYAHGYLVENSTDSYGNLSTQVLRLESKTHLPESVVLLGASAMRESLFLPALASGMQDMCSRKIEVVPMLADGLTDWEMAAITCSLGSKMNGVLIIEVAPGHLTRSLGWVAGLADSPRILIGNGCLDEQLRASGGVVPERSGNLFRDNLRFFAARPAILLNLVLGPKEIQYNQAQDWRKIGGESLDRAVLERVGWAREYGNLRTIHVAVYREMLSHIAREKVDVILLEAPRNPLCDAAGRGIPGYIGAKAMYERDIHELVSDFQVDYWQLDAEAALSAEDFADSAHLQDMEAIKRYTDIVTQRVSRILANRPTR